MEIEIKYNIPPFYTTILGGIYAWAGNAFEIIGLLHIDQIKAALGISGIQSKIYGWQNDKAQIDLVLDRNDKVINLIEMKFSENPYSITKDYDLKLRNKIAAYKEANPSSKSIWLVLLTTFGLGSMKNAGAVNSDIKVEALFRQI